MPLRKVPKSFISGLAHGNVLCVQVRSVYLSEVEVGASTTVYDETSVVFIHVVLCCTVVLRPGVLEFAEICVSRSLQSFGEATRLPRMLVACRSVPVRLFRVDISQCWSHA